MSSLTFSLIKRKKKKREKEKRIEMQNQTYYSNFLFYGL